jgi:hypothetical protein
MPKATTSRRAPVVRKLREPTEIGYIDSFLDGLLKGWAGSLVNPDSPVSVFIFIDGEPVDNFICEIDRPDVLAAGFPSARVGFSYRIPRATGRWYSPTSDRRRRKPASCCRRVPP